MFVKSLLNNRQSLLKRVPLREFSQTEKRVPIDEVPSLKDFIKANQVETEIEDGVEMGGDHMKQFFQNQA